MTKHDQSNSRHHYVQKAYLDKFAEKKKLDVINREDGTVRTGQATNDIANMRGLYSFTNEDGKKDGSFEGAFAIEIESPAIKIINNMTCVFPYIPHGVQRSTIAYYMAFQYMRTLEGKRRFETQFGTYSSIQMFNLANDSQAIKEFLKQKKLDSSKESVDKYRNLILERIRDEEIIPDSSGWLKYLKSGMDHIAPILVERFYWSLIYFDRPSLITSDHPVALRKIHDDLRGVGFGNADEIIFPLSMRHALLLTIDPVGAESVIFNPNPKLAEMINSYMSSGSYLEYYSPPSLTNQFRGKPLGKRGITEMTGGPGVGTEFLDKYVGVLERQRPKR